MSTSLRSLESQSLQSLLTSTTPSDSKLVRAINHGPPDALERLSVPAAAYLDPTPLQRAAQVGWQMGAAAVDLTFGTHWAITQRLQGASKLRSLHRDNRRVAQLLAVDPLLKQSSTSTQLCVRKNAHTVLALNRHGHYAAKVRQYLYGDSVVVGGVPFGIGLTIGPQIGGGISAAATAVAIPLLWVGGPILAAAALGVAVHEGLRYRRAMRLSRNVKKLSQHPVMGNEVAVQGLLAGRIRGKRVHASTKAASLVGCAISAPLLVVGIIPGVAVLAPAAAALTWAWYYHHNNLRYRPTLTPEERIMLGTKRDIVNRIDLAHQSRAILKELKAKKRLLYPRGGQAIMGMRHTAKSVAWMRRSWSGLPNTYATPHETVFSFLRSLCDEEVAFVRRQEVLQTHNLAKLGRSNFDAREIRRNHVEIGQRQIVLGAWLADRASESRLMQAYEAPPDAAAVTRHFLAFLQRHRLLDTFTREAILRNSKVKHLFLEHGVLKQDKENFHFELSHLLDLLDPPESEPTETTLGLAAQLCEIAERYLLKREKKRLTFSERELLDILAYRLDGPRHKDYPRHAKPERLWGARLGKP